AMPLVSWVHAEADVKKTEYIDSNVQIVFEATPEFAEKIKKRVHELKGKFEATHPPKDEKAA
ncbi:MAG: hypothetical protein ACQXXJ_06435, partial [Candidatus Bathyarchaeia archaeon]